MVFRFLFNALCSSNVIVELGDVHRSLTESNMAPIRQPGYHRRVSRGLIRRVLLVSGPSRLQRQSHASIISNAIQL